MQQLSKRSASFLYSDTARSNGNLSLLYIYDQSTAPGGTVRFKSILAHVTARLSRAPIFRQRLLRVPIEMDHPYWVEDENFDLEDHVSHIALPKPGDWRQLCIQVSRLHARTLDMNRPLWEIHVIEGLDGIGDLPPGSFAVLFKAHLAAVTVKQAAGLTQLLHDTDANPPAAAPPPPWFPDAPPGALSMVLRGAANVMGSPLRLATPIHRSLTKLTPAVLGLAGERLLRRSSTAITRFNAVVSPHRVFETARFAASEFDEIRALIDGATLNDAVIAVCGGALMRFLGARAELPATSLSAIARRSMPDEDGPGGSAQSKAWLPIRLGTELADPVLRLALIREQTRLADDEAPAPGPATLADWADRASNDALSMMRKLVGHVQLIPGQHAAMTNCTITHVPVPAEQLYLSGARMVYCSAMLPIADGLGLVFAVTYHDGSVVISPTSCRDLMPDPETFGEALRDSFQEYLGIARRSAPRRKTGRGRDSATTLTAPKPPHTLSERPQKKAPVRRTLERATLAQSSTDKRRRASPQG